MDLTYLLVLLVCFLGVFIGLLIAFLAKEELKDGKKYFIISKNIIFTLTIFLLLYFLKLHFLSILLVCLILLLVLFKVKIKEWILYSIIGIIFYISSLNSNLFTLNASLIFIYSIFMGSLFMEKNTKLNSFNLIYKLIKEYSLFVVVAIISFWIF